MQPAEACSIVPFYLQQLSRLRGRVSVCLQWSRGTIYLSGSDGSLLTGAPAEDSYVNVNVTQPEGLPPFKHHHIGSSGKVGVVDQ